MQESLVSNRPPLLSVFLILVVLFIGFIFIGPLIGFGVSSLFYDGDLLLELQKSNPDPAIFLPVMITQGITSLVGLIILPVVYLLFIEHKSLKPFFKKERDLVKTIVLLTGLALCFLVAISPVVEWNMNVQFPEFMQEFGKWAREQEDKLTEMIKLLTTFNTPRSFAIALVVIALLPGVGEELVFRGLIQNELWRGSNNIHASVWVSAILFSAIHMQFFGFVPRMLLGALFGYLYYWSGNLAVPMIAHFFHNGFTLTMMYLYNIKVIDVNIDSEESAPFALVGVSVLFTFTLIYIFKKHYTQEQPHS